MKNRILVFLVLIMGPLMLWSQTNKAPIGSSPVAGLQILVSATHPIHIESGDDLPVDITSAGALSTNVYNACHYRIATYMENTTGADITIKMAGVWQTRSTPNEWWSIDDKPNDARNGDNNLGIFDCIPNTPGNDITIPANSIVPVEFYDPIVKLAIGRPLDIQIIGITGTTGNYAYNPIAIQGSATNFITAGTILPSACSFFLAECIVASPNPTLVGGNLLVSAIVENASSNAVAAEIYIRIRQQGSGGLIEQTIDAKPPQLYDPDEQAIFNSTISATLDPRFNPGTAEVFVEYELTPGTPTLVKEYLCENPTIINIESACAAGIVPEPVSPGTNSSAVLQEITTLTPTFLWKKICTPNNSVTGYRVDVRDYPDNNPITTFSTSSTVYQHLIAPGILRPSTAYTWTVTALSPNGNQVSVPFYFETPGPSNSNCNVDDVLPSDTLLWDAVQYLCERGIVTPRLWYGPGQNDVSPTDNIVREHLAWITAAGLYGSKRAINSAYLYTQRYPIPFDDLAQAANNRDRYAKFLTYLDYDDQITPFDGDRHNFQPREDIRIKFALKVLLEAFNIDVSNRSTPLTNVTLPYAQSDSMYKYVSTATRLGLLDHYPMGTSADSVIKRGDAFIILYEIMIHQMLNRPSLSDFDVDTNFVESNFYKASNYAVRPSLADGNFSSYAKTSFVIPGTLMPLIFEHSYASSCLTMPKELFPMNPVGKSWSHNHHGYIIETTGSSKWGGIDDFNNGQFSSAFAIFFPGSQHPHLFRRNTNGTLEAATDGLNYRITEDAVNNRITIETMGRSRLVFEKLPAGTHMNNVYMIKEVSEKNGNKLLYYYSNYVADTSRLTRICAQYLDTLGVPIAPRCIDLIYNTGNYKDLIERIEYPSPTGGAPRQVFFDYYFTNKNLKSYKDALPVMPCSGLALPVEEYFYDTSAETPHLLNKIELPKGNYIDNTYHDRKLRSTTLSNSSGILNESNITPQYEKFTGNSSQTVTSSEANGGGTVTTMTQKRNNAGYITETDYLRSDGATDVFQIEYNNAQYPQNPTKVTAYGVVTNMSYNGNGQMEQKEVISTLQNLTYTEHWNYGGDSLLRTYTNRRGHSMTYDYDARKNVTEVTDFEGHDTRYAYYPNGLRKTVTTPTQKTYRFIYDPYGNLISSIGPTGITTTNTYDLVGRLTEARDALGNATTMEYFENDLPSKVTRIQNGIPHSVEYCYDANYNNIWIEDEKGQRTNMKYTIAEDYLEEIEFGGNVRAFDYTAKGLLKEEITPNGHTKTYQYNIHNELLESDGYASYEYDPNDRDHLTTVRLLSNPTREYIEYHYDDFDRVSDYEYHSNGQSYTINYIYDEESNVIGITYPDNGGARMTVNYTYNKNNQLETVNALGMTWQAYRRSDGSITKITYPNGMEKRYNYDNADRVDDLGYFSNAAAPVPSNTLSRQQFTIDDRGFFTQEVLTGPSQGALLPDIDIQFAQNAQNRVISKTNALTGQSATASFDSDGNQFSTDIGGTGVGTYTGMIWNHFEQLEVIENVSGTFRGNYTYGVLGQRNTAQRTRNGVSTTTNYFWEVSGTGNMLREERDSAAIITSLDYLYGFGEILARIPTDYTDANLPLSAYRDTVRFFISDMRGTVIGLVDYDQNFTEKYEVTSYGEMISHEMVAGEVPNYFIFVGAYGVEWEDTSLYKMGVRYYDVEQVRFLSEDPIWNTNLHGYAGGNTVMAIDPGGLSWNWLNNPYVKEQLQGAQRDIDNAINSVNNKLEEARDAIYDGAVFVYNEVEKGTINVYNAAKKQGKETVVSVIKKIDKKVHPIVAKNVPNHLLSSRGVNWSNYNANKNYCGADKYPATNVGWFNKSCFIHDEQYGMLGRSKELTDIIFHQNMLIENNGGVKGERIANSLYLFVKYGGHGIYKSAQEEARIR